MISLNSLKNNVSKRKHEIKCFKNKIGKNSYLSTVNLSCLRKQKEKTMSG